MTTLQFEGVTVGIAEAQFKFIEDVLVKRGINDKKVLIEVVGVAGDNYMANVRRFTVPDVDGKPFKMIAKFAPTIEQLRLAANTPCIFFNEHVMYTEVLPKFKSMQIAADVPEADMLRFAECYGTYMEAPNEVILLEDLKESNFVMLDRFQSLSNDCIRSVLKNFAILHSLSYALKYKEPETYDKFRHRLYDTWSLMNKMPETQNYFTSIGQQALKLMTDNERRESVLRETSMGDMISLINKLTKEDADSKYNVILQGDAWTNNIMFKFDGDMLMESIMIDYQISRESKPVCDILYLIFNCTDYETRLKYYYEWIDYYHTELDKALSNYGLKANFVYSRDQLDVDLKRYAKVMFKLCIFFSSILTMKSEDAAKFQENLGTSDMDVNTLSNSFMELNSVADFKARIEGLIDSFLEFGLLYAKQ